MTDELIEAVAKAIGQIIEGPAEDMDSNWYGHPLWQSYEREARAAIRVIAPAVLEQAAKVCLDCDNHALNNRGAAAIAIRALKEGYIHDQ